MQTLSIVIPVYNEEKTMYQILSRIEEVQIPDITKELIIVNDASKDNTESEIHKYRKDFPKVNIKYFAHKKNQGKGAAIHTAIAHATGEYILIQDADMEYDPNDYTRLLQPIIEDKADVVYGSRFIGDYPHRTLYFWHYIGNKFLTFISNIFSNLNLTDIETCYKVFRTNILKSIHLKEKRFGFEPEITQKIAKIPHIRIYEIGISYYGRTYSEGKKITRKDGVRTLLCILKYGISKK